MKGCGFIATGGTGGHIFPAQGLARELSKACPNGKFYLIGANLHTRSFVDRGQVHTLSVMAGSISFRKPFRSLLSAVKLCLGFFQSLFFILRYRPSWVVGFGSFNTFPILLAAVFLRVPIALHEGNSVPGQVNRLFSPWARWVGIQFPQARQWLKGQSVPLTLPIRWEVPATLWPKQPRPYTLLVFGGSQGAQYINEVMQGVAERLAESAWTWSIIHLTGHAESTRKLKEHYQALGISATVESFQSEINKYWLQADCILSRAGASTFAEMLAFQRPGLLIPYPYAKDQHQQANAQYIAEDVRGGEVLPQEEASADKIWQTLQMMHKKHDQYVQAIQNYVEKQSQEKSFVERVLSL